MMRSVILFTFLINCIYRLLKREALKIPLYTICLLLIFGVALSRIILGAHFLSDTLAAISISLAWFCLCLYCLPIIYKKIQPKM
ncbi:hypothetical protein BTO30_11030 [Domibacillus antri]|uniref:Phosphatidic acid phosphatase type 2/haloperoxidase domain-containing protein n=2 Tax=Domibacillus antri TaxID=1714264 RepID=A0A1Q8Q4J3_9BACI|nr:hypothetical protein BTO30_11030 [Domibacillus antri]